MIQKVADLGGLGARLSALVGATRAPMAGTATVRPGPTRFEDRPVSAKRRLLYLVTEDWFFCSHFLPMAAAARDCGLDALVCTQVRNHGERIEARGLRVIPLPMRRRSLNPLHSVRLIHRVVRILREEDPGIVHLIALKPILIGGIAAAFVRRPAVVYAVTGFGYLAVSRGIKARLLWTLLRPVLVRLLNRPNARLLLENADDRDALAAMGVRTDGRVTIVAGAGVDVDHFAALPPPSGAGVSAAMVGRMLWTKGADVLVEAQRRLAARGVGLRVLLVGTPDPDNPWAVPERTLKAWDREAGIRWLGSAEDVREVWREADIAVLPSRGGEGMPRALLEAAACARPIVTTDVPGCREFVRDGVEGRVVPPDDAAALADALTELVSRPDLRRSMGEAARRRVLGGFTEARVKDQVRDVYLELLGPPRTRPEDAADAPRCTHP